MWVSYEMNQKIFLSNENYEIGKNLFLKNYEISWEEIYLNFGIRS